MSHLGTEQIAEALRRGVGSMVIDAKGFGWRLVRVGQPAATETISIVLECNGIEQEVTFIRGATT